MGGINNKHISITSEVQQLIDGLLLSDACIRLYRNKKTARLMIGQTIRYKAWIQDISKILQENNIQHTIRERTQTVHLPQDPIGVKKQFKRIDLSTLMYIEFKTQYDRWHKDNKKIIPKDIDLTPIILANWHMGDGNLDIIKTSKIGQKFYRITLCTECFTHKEHQLLQQQLNRKYNWQPYIQKYKNTWRLRINKKQDVTEFLKITYPYISKCFDYKWKAIFDRDFIEQKRKINICEICKKKYKTQKYHHEQTVCSKECRKIKNKLQMRKYRKN